MVQSKQYFLEIYYEHGDDTIDLIRVIDERCCEEKRCIFELRKQAFATEVPGMILSDNETQIVQILSMLTTDQKQLAISFLKALLKDQETFSPDQVSDDVPF